MSDQGPGAVAGRRRKPARASGLVIVGVMLGRRQLRRLDAWAARERRSRSFVLRDVIDDALARRGAEAQGAAG